jgi:hypothetical protein
MKRVPTEHDKVKKHEWYVAHQTLCIQRTKDWRKSNPDGRRKRRRTARGVLNATGETKKAPCEICLRILQLRQDHNHKTGLRRGWICSRCNLMLGWWEIIKQEGAAGLLESYKLKY